MEHQIKDINAYGQYMTLIQANYIRFDNRRQLKKYRKSLTTFVEVHHIIPRSMGGDDSIDNLVCLSATDHFIAHKLLYFAYQTREMCFAFNQMRRVAKQYPELLEEYAYEQFRIDLSKHMVDVANTRVANMTQSEKERISKLNSVRMKGKINVIDTRTGICSRIDKTEFNPEYHMYPQTGSKRSESTRRVMREKSNVSSRGRPFYHPALRIIKYFRIGDPVDDGFIPGNGLQNVHTKGTVFYHNPLTGEQIRCPINEQPTDWVRGRFTFDNPFANKSILKHFVTNEVKLTTDIIPFFTHTKADKIVSYTALDGKKEFGGSMAKIAERLKIAPNIILKSVEDSAYVISARHKKEYRDRFLGKNVATELYIRFYTVDDLTEDVIHDLLVNYTWVG